MAMRNAVILWLTLTGVVLLAFATSADRRVSEAVASGGCWLLAWVYAQLTRGGRGGQR